MTRVIVRIVKERTGQLCRTVQGELAEIGSGGHTTSAMSCRTSVHGDTRRPCVHSSGEQPAPQLVLAPSATASA